ncbi:MAG: hypothetical protein AAF664_18220, partial [Planctomycetota bacterium]
IPAAIQPRNGLVLTESDNIDDGWHHAAVAQVKASMTAPMRLLSVPNLKRLHRPKLARADSSRWR